MLSLRQLTLSRGTKILLDNANLSLFEKQKVGLIGHNGCGKSTLFELLLGKISPDTGEFSLNPQIRINHLSQHIPDTQDTAIDYVLAGDKVYSQLMQKLHQAEQNENHETVLACHEQLANLGAYSKPAEAATILSGLGFKTHEQNQPVNSFSGGWRMRLNLARCLIAPADLLLLDEPTNHLDMEAIFWLEKFLKLSPASIILISHDREFLDAFVTHIVHIERQKLSLFSGNYSTFEKTHAQQLSLQQAMYEKQQTKINHMMSFVNRFKAKATKAKQAQGRLKAISRMELIAAAQVDSPFSFEFFSAPKAGNPLIQCSAVDAGYRAEAPILSKINFSLSPGDRIALLGANGQGKSTFIKTLVGLLPPLNGTLHQSSNLHLGYYAQHQLEQLDCALSPIQTIQKLSPIAREQEIRNFLGGFNFIGDMATHSIEYFSGGEKARLALAKLVWLKPNILLLDEPTNHLDLGMRSAIELALQSYEGAVILISHDRHLLKTAVDEYYLVHDGKVESFAGDLDDYHQWLQKSNKAQGKKEKSSPVVVSKEKNFLQKRLKKLDELLQQYQKEITLLDESLLDQKLYLTEHKSYLDKLLVNRTELLNKLQSCENQWIELYNDFENVS